MKKEKTIAKQESFCYEDKILFVYGDCNSYEKFTLKHLAKLLQHFCCREVKIGATHNSNVQEGTLEEYLRTITKNKTSIASYIAAILVREGFVRKEDERTIKFICCDEKNKRFEK